MLTCSAHNCIHVLVAHVRGARVKFKCRKDHLMKIVPLSHCSWTDKTAYLWYNGHCYITIKESK